MYWHKVSERDLPALLAFLLPLEKFCLSFTSRLISDGAFTLPHRREALIFAACTGGTVPPDSQQVLKPEHIIAAVMVSSRGLILPVHQPGIRLPGEIIDALLAEFYRYSRKLYCLIGLAETVRQYEKFIREKIDTRILYHLMYRPVQTPLPRNIFTPGLQIHFLTAKDVKKVYHLEEEYQHEEVLVHPERFSSAAHLVYFKRLVKEQEIFYATIHGAAVAKAGTNAIGKYHSQIGGVYTARTYRGRGIARSLLIRLLEEISSRDHGAVLFVRKTNKPAVHLYKKLGFHIIGEFQITYSKLD